MTDTAARSATPARPFDRRAALKEAGIAAFVMLALSLALVAVRVEDVPGGLAIRWRPFDVAAAVVLVFLGRMGLAFLRHGRAAGRHRRAHDEAHDGPAPYPSRHLSSLLLSLHVAVPQNRRRSPPPARKPPAGTSASPPPADANSTIARV